MDSGEEIWLVLTYRLIHLNSPMSHDLAFVVGISQIIHHRPQHWNSLIPLSWKKQFDEIPIKIKLRSTIFFVPQKTYLTFRLTCATLFLGTSAATDLFCTAACWSICPAAWCWSWFCVGMTILSVSESRRELFAVEVAVLGLSRPPALPTFGSLAVCDDDLSDWIAAGSGDFDWIEVTSWIDGRA